jgi:hypothetical protein
MQGTASAAPLEGAAHAAQAENAERDAVEEEVVLAKLPEALIAGSCGCRGTFTQTSFSTVRLHTLGRLVGCCITTLQTQRAQAQEIAKLYTANNEGAGISGTAAKQPVQIILRR